MPSEENLGAFRVLMRVAVRSTGKVESFQKQVELTLHLKVVAADLSGVIAECSANLLTTTVVNRMRSDLRPDFGDPHLEPLQDNTKCVLLNDLGSARRLFLWLRLRGPEVIRGGDPPHYGRAAKYPSTRATG